MITDAILQFSVGLVGALIDLLPDNGGTSLAESLMGPVATVTDQGVNAGPAGILIDPTVFAALVGTFLTLVLAFLSMRIAIFIWQQVKW